MREIYSSFSTTNLSPLRRGRLLYKGCCCRFFFFYPTPFMSHPFRNVNKFVAAFFDFLLPHRQLTSSSFLNEDVLKQQPSTGPRKRMTRGCYGQFALFLFLSLIFLFPPHPLKQKRNGTTYSLNFHRLTCLHIMARVTHFK